ncbi:GNAT family protein [Nocardioides korecus]
MHTERLLLRPPEDADVERLLSFRTRPEVTHWLIRPRIDPTTYAAELLRATREGDDHDVVAVLGEEIVGTGWLGVRDGLVQDVGATDLPREGRLGYALDPAYVGRGLATEMARALLDVAFGQLGLRRVTAGCYADNLASWRVMEKLGMRREQHGVADSWHAELGWVDGFTYAVLREEWPTGR